MRGAFLTALILAGCSTGVDPIEDPGTVSDTPPATSGPTGSSSPSLPDPGVPRGIPDGLIALFDLDECPEGWSEWFPARGRGLVAVATADEAGVEVGDPLEELIPRGHGHTADVRFDLPGSGVAGVSGCCNWGPGQSGLRTASGAIDDHVPDHPLVAVKVCRYATAIEPEAHVLPAGTAAFFDRSACPTGMAPYAEVAGYFPVGAIANAGVGVPIGDPLASGEVREHGHTAQFTVDIPEYDVALAGGSNNDHVQKGLHTLDTATDSGTMGLPYVQTLLCEVLADAPATEQDEHLTEGALIWSHDVACPDGWEEEIGLRGRLPVGAPSLSNVGSTWSVPFEDGEDRAHDHGFAYTLEVLEQGVAAFSGCCFGDMGPKGTYTVGGTVDAVSTGLPWVQLRACRRPLGG